MADLKQDKTRDRNFYFDFLRALAIFAVIILHNSADQVDQYGKLPTTDWLSAAFYNGLTRFCVPMFVLLSGALLLDPAKEITIKELFTKRLPRLVIPLLVWSVFYEIFQYSTDKGYGQFHLIVALKTFYQGPLVFHFWFLYMLIGIYLIYPVLNAFVRAASRSLVFYFIVLWFITNCVFGMIGIIYGLSLGVELYGFTGYLGYFMLGYYLQHFSFSKQQLNIIYGLGILSIVASIAATVLLHTQGDKSALEIIESDFTPEIPFTLAGLFLLLKNHAFGPGQTWFKSVMSQLGRESYGIYIVHVLWMRLLFDKLYLGLGFGNQSLLWVIPFKGIVVLALSYGLTKLIRLVPLLRATV
ncbi:acyltransferase family protein [Mucilaginibacter sp. BJC16-A38]|uniref:acyltransferase n=1 Tax=Mucilaginibacter phenanthrenivorans TaxID=1234842 RepID=UPI002157237F|nr:acyltransferase family protein [Mucilaginibacter phenanthrenivorans]MCR8559184.1 acyltransferase family protein [Mucilaginibacter phenanthrenivorans]